MCYLYANTFKGVHPFLKHSNFTVQAYYFNQIFPSASKEKLTSRFPTEAMQNATNWIPVTWTTKITPEECSAKKASADVFKNT